MFIHRRLPRSGTRLFVAAFLAVTLFTILGLTPSRNDPFHAPYIDNQTHSIAANSDFWFRFDYGFVGPPRTVVTLRMINGAAKGGPDFEVWAPEIISEWWQEKPTGRGMVQSIDCATGALVGGGQCQSADLIWVGAFGSVGTYYVHVVNNNSSPMNFVLTVQGSSVSPVPAPAPGAAATQLATPLAPPPPSTPPLVTLPVPPDDPNRALPIDGLVHTLPGNAAQWYKFDYTVISDPFHPQVGLRLVGAVGTGVIFQVWPPEKLNNWWLDHPVGQGTVEYFFSCESQEFPTLTPFPTNVATYTPTPTSTPVPTLTPLPPPICTKTPTTNLTWFGGFGVSGTYYVRVVNTSPFPANYQLTMFF